MHKSSVRCTKSRVAMPKVPQILKTFSVHGWTLEGALNLAPQSPFLHVAELWSGVGNVVKKAEALGLLAKPFDKYRVPGVTDQPGPGCEDLLTHEGFRTALIIVLSIVPGGLLVLAPDCSSMGFLNISNTKRSNENPMGDCSYTPVIEGNKHSRIAAFLYALACCIGVLCVTENPTTSYQFKQPWWDLVSSCFPLSFSNLSRCAFTDRPFGQRYLKIYKLAGKSWVKTLGRRCVCPGLVHKATATIRVMENGKKEITGIHDALSASAAYPPRMAEWLVKKWLEASPTMQSFTNQAQNKQQNKQRTDWKWPSKKEPSSQKKAGKSHKQKQRGWKQPVA